MTIVVTHSNIGIANLRRRHGVQSVWFVNGRECGQAGGTSADDADVASFLLLGALAGSFHG